MSDKMSEVDWENDEAVVRAAVPNAYVGHQTGWIWALGNIRYVLGESWTLARQHPTVIAFERESRPVSEVEVAKKAVLAKWPGAFEDGTIWFLSRKGVTQNDDVYTYLGTTCLGTTWLSVCSEYSLLVDGTFNCPICGLAGSHNHSADEIAASNLTPAAVAGDAVKSLPSFRCDHGTDSLRDCPMCMAEAEPRLTEKQLEDFRRQWHGKYINSLAQEVYEQRKLDEKRLTRIADPVGEREGEFEACPFCGSSDIFTERADYSSCFVICNNCSVRGPVMCQESDEEDKPGEAAAGKAWNTRAALASKQSAEGIPERPMRERGSIAGVPEMVIDSDKFKDYANKVEAIISELKADAQFVRGRDLVLKMQRDEALEELAALKLSSARIEEAVEITPTSNGTVSLEWKGSGCEVYLEIGKTKINGFIRSKESLLTMNSGAEVIEAILALIPTSPESQEGK